MWAKIWDSMMYRAMNSATDAELRMFIDAERACRLYVGGPSSYWLAPRY